MKSAKHLSLAALLSIVSVVAASAQDMQMRFKDAGFVTHSIHGSGVELQFEVRGVSVADIPDEAFKGICLRFGPEIISQVLETQPSFEPDFVGIRMLGSGVFSSFKFIAYEYEAMGCGVER